MGSWWGQLPVRRVIEHSLASLLFASIKRKENTSWKSRLWFNVIRNKEEAKAAKRMKWSYPSLYLDKYEQQEMFVTCDDCGRFQLTGTRTVFELDPEEVEDVLRVTAIARAFPSLTPDPCRSSYLRPITGVWTQYIRNSFKNKQVLQYRLNIDT